MRTAVSENTIPNSVSDSADVPVALHSSRGELVKCTLCIYTHTLSYTFTGGKKVTPSSVSDSADVPVLHSSRGELVKCTLCIYTHTLSYTFTGGKKVPLVQSRTVLMSQFFTRQEVS